MTNEEIDQKIAIDLMENELHPYSTDTGFATRVLEVLHKKGLFWRLDSVHDGVICTLQDIKRKTYQVRASTIALAICEAALRTAANEKVH